MQKHPRLLLNGSVSILQLSIMKQACITNSTLQHKMFIMSLRRRSNLQRNSGVLQHLPSVKTRLHCLQAFLSLHFQSSDIISEVKQMFLSLHFQSSDVVSEVKQTFQGTGRATGICIIQ